MPSEQHEVPLINNAVETNETIYKPRVLKLSEMALSISDDKGNHYVSEAGNSQYAPQEIFSVEQTADGELVVLVEGKRDRNSFPTWELTSQDVVKLGSFLGHVPVSDFFASWEPGLHDDRELVWEFSQKEEEVRRRLSYVSVLARAAGTTNIPQDFDRAVWALTAQADKKLYSPNDLLESYTEIILDKIASNEGADPALVQRVRESINALGLFTNKEEEFIVQYFYLYASLQKVDFEDIYAIVESLRYFPFVETLLKKFNDHPDSSFGDNLLGALSRFSNEFYEE
ncbi:MAG: hypothetical protein H6773_00595 [Pseudomonadales bacterium]|nr:hypothetical protein [Candidatus Woesebacteria bacterium]MCB9800660.1 hypothetical protein [Pseudomonadales bacterium]